MVGDHAGAGHGEAGEDADAVHRDERRHLGPGRQQQGDGRAGQQQDPVGEDEPVAAHRQLAGKERVLGHEADQEGEPGEARVGGENEDQGGGGLQ